MKHTPKPWHIEKGQFSSAWFIHHLGSEVCMIPSYTLSQEANAHLIAAAPELLQACEEAVKDLEATSNGQGDEKLTVAKLKTAIKKATKEFPGVWGGIQSQVKALRHDLPFTVFKKRRSSRIEVPRQEIRKRYDDKKFGTIAISKGFITKDQLIEGLARQVEEDLTEGKHRPIGAILFGLGYLPKAQAIEVLRSMNPK
jgi:hypothetical protein